MKGKPNNLFAEKVVQLSYLPNDEYDELLKSSILFLCMYDTSANNAVIECINGCIPFVAYRHPAIEEYVGNEYPLLLTKQEINCLTKSQLVELAILSHKYLQEKRINLLYSIDEFRSDIIKLSGELLC